MPGVERQRPKVRTKDAPSVLSHLGNDEGLRALFQEPEEETTVYFFHYVTDMDTVGSFNLKSLRKRIWKFPTSLIFGVYKANSSSAEAEVEAPATSWASAPTPRSSCMPSDQRQEENL